VLGTTAATAGQALAAFSATQSTAGHIDFYKSANAAIGSATVVASGDVLGSVNWYGAQQTGTFATQTRGARIRAEVSGTVTSGGSGDMPTKLVFSTTADGGSDVTDQVTINETGDLRVTTPGTNSASVTTRSTVGVSTGFLFGLTLSNNVSDATNDIDIATGYARDSTDVYTMVLGSALTKRLDASWAVGTNQGGLDTGSIANTTYHVWLIRRSDTGVVDALFSTSATAPTMPTNYDQMRRIGSIIRSAGAILGFYQDPQNPGLFKLNTGVAATLSGGSADTTAGDCTCTVPAGINVRPFVQVNVSARNIRYTFSLGNKVETSTPMVAVLSVGEANSSLSDGVQNEYRLEDRFTSNTSSIIRYSLVTDATGTGGSSAGVGVTTYGWHDRRGT
jgi:hypothetical protein